MWAGGVADLSCLGSTLGYVWSAAGPGVLALDPPGVAYVLAYYNTDRPSSVDVYRRHAA